MQRVIKSVLTSRITLLALVGVVLVVSNLENYPRRSLAGKQGSIRDFHEYISSQVILKDGREREDVRARRSADEVEQELIKRHVLRDDGGDIRSPSAAVNHNQNNHEDVLSHAHGAAESSADRPQNVHVHIIAIGDSLTEGVLRAKEGSTKLLYSPYVDPLKRHLLQNLSHLVGGDRVVSVTSQVLAYRGKTAGGILHLAGAKMFVSNETRQELVPAAIPADVQRVLLNHQDAERGTLDVDRVVFVCSVLAGTNDLLRAPGSLVAPSLPPVKASDTVHNTMELHALCADYARAVAKRTVPHESPLRVEVMLLPVAMPPAMLDERSVVHQRLAKSLEKARGSVRATYGYCFSAPTSAAAMIAQHRRVNDVFTSPGIFVEGLERIAQRARLDDGGEAVGRGDTLFGALGQSAGANVRGTSTARTPRGLKKAIVTFTSKETVRLDADVLPDDVTLWSDCLHLTPKGYAIVGERIAKAIHRQLL